MTEKQKIKEILETYDQCKQSRISDVSGMLPLSTEQQRFIEWISCYDEWHWSSVRKQWEQEHYRSRNTQELFEYYLKRKTESGNFR